MEKESRYLDHRIVLVIIAFALAAGLFSPAALANDVPLPLVPTAEGRDGGSDSGGAAIRDAIRQRSEDEARAKREAEENEEADRVSTGAASAARKKSARANPPVPGDPPPKPPRPGRKVNVPPIR